MANTVFILGAGFSFDAGIPLLGRFIERMLLIAAERDKTTGKLSGNDRKLFDKALDIRDSMDGYHGRISFDDRNIEDILSMLAFSVMGTTGLRKPRANLDAFIQAISRTIELTCAVKHPGPPIEKKSGFTIVDTGPAMYRRFWQALFKAYNTGMDFPCLITFNYDLVLERSLFQVLINKIYNPSKNRCPFDSFHLNYSYKNSPNFYGAIEPCQYQLPEHSYVHGTKVIPKEVQGGKHLNIDILKLHGSLNFSRPITSEHNQNPCEVVENPYILPPISNKSASPAGEEIWGRALTELRNAKNVVFIGYSLPTTDIYMQFFIKAALGPNKGLEKVIVIDPVFNEPSQECEDMKVRYKNCFSEQLRRRLSFSPITAAKFVGELSKDPGAYIY
ncbi:MAG: hypothetical protein OEL83_10310 [Desulforhopalus sp.]|nr:hypothetical protein [Desulforhopalus sp.]